MTLMDAQPFNEARARRRRITIGAIVVGVLVLAWLAWSYRYYPQERVVTKFFDALQTKQFETAYGLWFNDPQWQQHPDKYSGKYPYNEFYRDWGPGGEWGAIRSFKIYASGTPPGGGSGEKSNLYAEPCSRMRRPLPARSDTLAPLATIDM